jgi:hypothetical protein
MLNRIFTGDESWVHHYKPESRRAAVKWKHPSSPSTKRCKVTRSAGKVMLTVFWDSHGILFSPFSEAWWKCEFCIGRLLWSSIEVSDRISRKRAVKLTRGVLLHHDNARPHTARAIQDRIQEHSGNFLNIRLTARTLPLVTSICLVC